LQSSCRCPSFLQRGQYTFFLNGADPAGLGVLPALSFAIAAIRSSIVTFLSLFFPFFFFALDFSSSSESSSSDSSSDSESSSSDSLSDSTLFLLFFLVFFLSSISSDLLAASTSPSKPVSSTFREATDDFSLDDRPRMNHCDMVLSTGLSS